MFQIFSRGPHGTERSPWQVTRSVWYAMFMREAISRTMTDRMGWFWMIAEPLAFTLIMISVRSFISGDRLIVGADFIPWMVVGLMGFFLVRGGMLRALGSIESNQALLAYRQVQPVDSVLVRNFLEMMLRTLVFLLFMTGAVMLGMDIMPDQALYAMWDWFALWCLGLGLGLIVSVAGSLVPEVGKIVRMISMPLLILSGVLFPLNNLPHWLLEYIMFNPIVHGLELLRVSFFEGYQVIHGTSATYYWGWALGSLALGLLMHMRFKDRLKAR